MALVKELAFPPGYIIVTSDSGAPQRVNVKDFLRASDIPVGLTYEQVSAVTTLANLLVVLIRTLIDRDVLNESFLEDGEYDLAAIVQSIEEMGGAYLEPDISVT